MLNNNNKAGVIAIHVVLVFVSLAVMFPIFWMVSTSLRLPQELFTSDLRLIPQHPTLLNYSRVWELYPMIYWVRNSVVTSFAITLGQLFIALLAAYSFARYRFPGQNFLFYAVVATPLIPFMVVLIPNYILISRMKLLNNLLGVILPYLRAGLATFLLRQFIRTLPPDLCNSAEIDGANSWSTLWRIVVPNLKSGIVVVFIMVFINDGWNIYFWPLLVLVDSKLQTIPIGLRSFMDADVGYQWGQLMAAASYATIPPLIVFFITQKYVINAFVNSGMKD